MQIIFFFSLAYFQGMEYLHKSQLKVHGTLRSKNCLLDLRWTLKISDYGLIACRMKQYATEHDRYFGLFTDNFPMLFVKHTSYKEKTQYGAFHVYERKLKLYFVSTVMCTLFMYLMLLFA